MKILNKLAKQAIEANEIRQKIRELNKEIKNAPDGIPFEKLQRKISYQESKLRKILSKKEIDRWLNRIKGQ